jgi:hypothetical protein
MERDRRSDLRGAQADPPSRVEVTIVRGPPAPPGRAAHAVVGTIAAAARSRAVIGLAAALIAVVALAVILSAPWSAAWSGTPAGTPPGAAAGAGAPSAPQSVSQLAAVYRYPPRCISTTISIAESAKLARDRQAGLCWRYGVFVTAILSRVADQWQLALKAISPSCPGVSLPFAVPAKLAICRRPPASGGRRPAP